MENITKISDLPQDGQGMQLSNQYASNIPPPAAINVSKASKMDPDTPTNYTPINTHPNPYGISGQNPIMDNQGQSVNMGNNMPQQSSENIQMQVNNGMESLQNLQQQRLPSRDIPQDTTQYSNDNRVQPNYIPQPESNRDYVREQEDMTERNLREYEKKQQNVSYWDMIFTDIQTPIFIAVLFFLFQLPIVNTIIFKRFAFLSLYNEDGNFNTGGLLFKSTLFGLIYLLTYKFTTFISEF